MITITLVDNGTKRYAMVTSGTILGRMYDNNSETITVIKPASEVDRVCTMIVTATSSGCFAAKTIDEIEVGNSPVNISNSLSQYSEVKIGFSFSDDTGYVKNSEVQTFKFLEAQKPDNWEPDDSEIEYKVEQVIQKGFIKVTWSTTSPNTLVFKNLAGDIVDEIELSPFVQEQSNLAETDTTSETFVRNKSTKYLENEGSDGTSPYAEIKDLPTKTSDLQNDSGFIDNTVNDLVNYTDTTTLNNTLNKVVQSDTGVTVSGDNVSLSKSYVNVGTGTTSTNTTAIPLADDENAGLMSHSDYLQIRQNTQKISQLENKTTRLLYTNTITNETITISDTTTLSAGTILKSGSIVNGETLLEDTTYTSGVTLITNDEIAIGSTIINGSVVNGTSYPTATQINAFVVGLGFISPFEGIAVVTGTTYHIWHYYEGGVGWKDDGVDTVSNFTNSYAGVIKGSTADGKVYAETDGTGSINGWDSLKNRVLDVEQNKASLTDLADKQDLTASGSSDPTSSTVGTLNQFYRNTSTNKVFICTEVTAQGTDPETYVYSWEEVNTVETDYETYTISSWSALSGSEPFTFSATVTATHTIGNDTEIELINDNAVLFANYGFAIGSVSGQNVTIYAIDEPSSDVSLTIGYRG